MKKELFIKTPQAGELVKVYCGGNLDDNPCKYGEILSLIYEEEDKIHNGKHITILREKVLLKEIPKIANIQIINYFLPKDKVKFHD